MIPISAVSAEPARPVTKTAQSTGPSSRIRDRATAGPRYASEPNRERVKKICRPSTMPVNAPVSTTMVSERKPMKWIRSSNRTSLKGGVSAAATACARNRPKRPSASTTSRTTRPSAATGRSGNGHVSEWDDENIARY